MAQVRRHVRIPIATGERLYTKFPFFELLKAEAVDVLQPDICNAGGITELKKIAAIAEAQHVTDGPPQHQQPHRHRGQLPPRRVPAQLPDPGVPRRVLRAVFFDLVPGPAPAQRAPRPPPSGPGLGITLDEAVARAHPLEVPPGLGRAWDLSPAPSSSTWTGRWWTPSWGSPPRWTPSWTLRPLPVRPRRLAGLDRGPPGGDLHHPRPRSQRLRRLRLRRRLPGAVPSPGRPRLPPFPWHGGHPGGLPRRRIAPGGGHLQAPPGGPGGAGGLPAAPALLRGRRRRGRLPPPQARPGPGPAGPGAPGAPPPRRAAWGPGHVVGDTEFDLGMARAAGCRPIGVGWGYRPPEVLRAAGAVAIAGTPQALLSLLLPAGAQPARGPPY